MKILRAPPMPRHHFHYVNFGLLDRFMVKVEREEPSFNRRMFDEDFAKLFRSRKRQSGNLFEVLSNDDELTQRLLSNVETRFAPHPRDETIQELAEEIAQTIIRHGTAYYFIHDDSKHEDVRIVSLSSTGIARLFGINFQWVPTRTETHWDRNDEEMPREIRILESAKIMSFKMPKTIKRVLSAQNRTLAALDKHFLGASNFLTQPTHENPNPTNHFNFGVWRDTRDHALYRSTRATGWNGREYTSSKPSDFFVCHRLIRFRRNQLILRDKILSQLSVELSRIGKSYNSDYSVIISATDKLPSIKHLNELEASLAQEKVGFTEITDYCLKQ